MHPTRNKVRFVLGSTPLEISLDDPSLTLLDYLRNQACLTGTKEGCAEGDCGACTVLIAELYDNNLKYTAANACILLLGMVDGKQVLTVEHLASDTLHPAQQAMIDHHGSQCGFCTPGFVMSIAALQLDVHHGDSIQTPDREQIDQQLITARKILIEKLPGKINCADVGTKILSEKELGDLLLRAGLSWEM